jgi:hypothetical protein
VRRLAALCLLISSAAFAQSNQSRIGGVYFVPPYYGWQLYLTSNVTAGTFPVQISAGSITLSDGRQAIPFAVGAPVLIDNGANQETITPTAVKFCFSTPNPFQPCTITATFTKAHVAGALVRSSSFGLQEAINDAAVMGGVVVVDATFQGSTATITGAAGSVKVAIQDNRSGLPQNYSWTGSAYALAASNGLGDPGSNGIVKRTGTNATAPAAASDVASLYTGCSGGTNLLGSDGICHVGSGLPDPGSNGVVKRSGANATAVAAASDITAMFSGCSGTLVLGADGACHAAGGLADPGSNGLLKRSALNTTAIAAVADVTGLFSGCSGTQYLGFDGACHTANGLPSGCTSGGAGQISCTSGITAATLQSTQAGGGLITGSTGSTPSAVLSGDGIFFGTDGIYAAVSTLFAGAWKKFLVTGTVDASDITSGLLTKLQTDNSSTGNGLGTVMVSQADVDQCPVGFLNYLGGTNWNCQGFIQNTVTATYTIAASDLENVVFSTIAADTLFSIPAPNAGSFAPPAFFFFKNDGNSVGHALLTPSGGVTIDGSASKILNPGAWSIVYASDTTHWRTLTASTSGEVVIN